MKRKALIPILSCTTACLLSGTALAQVVSDYPSSRDTRGTTTTTTTTRTTEPIRAVESKSFLPSKDLVGARVKDSQGQTLGDITEIYLNPQSGHAFAAVNIGQRRHAMVPLQAFTLSAPAGAIRDAQVTLNKPRSELEAGPTITGNDWKKLEDPLFTKSILSHYQLQRAPSAVGGSDDDSMTDPDTGTSSSTDTNHVFDLSLPYPLLPKKSPKSQDHPSDDPR